MDTIWHITPDGTPATPGAEPFVHASFSAQLAGTLEVHFEGVPAVVLLRLDPQSLGERLVVEPSRDGMDFPHIYGEIRADDVLETVTLRRPEPGQAFDLGPVSGR